MGTITKKFKLCISCVCVFVCVHETAARGSDPGKSRRITSVECNSGFSYVYIFFSLFSISSCAHSSRPETPEGVSSFTEKLLWKEVASGVHM